MIHVCKCNMSAKDESYSSSRRIPSKPGQLPVAPASYVFYLLISQANERTMRVMIKLRFSKFLLQVFAFSGLFDDQSI